MTIHPTVQCTHTLCMNHAEMKIDNPIDQVDRRAMQDSQKIRLQCPVCRQKFSPIFDCCAFFWRSFSIFVAVVENHNLYDWNFEVIELS